jgi:predicted deacylase
MSKKSGGMLKNDIKHNVDFMEKLNLNFSFISYESGGNIIFNNNMAQNIPKHTITNSIIKQTIKGTPIFRFGSNFSDRPKVAIISGIHGNELPPQIASLLLINKLQNRYLDGTVYVIPFSAPKATMNNSRWFNTLDLNRSATIDGSVSNLILKKIKELNLDSVGDFHSTAPNSNPGREGIFCTLHPSSESYEIGKYISNNTGSDVIYYKEAGSAYKGALEDECNLLGIPSVTCEVLSPNGQVNEKTYLRSLAQMECYLKYFNII